MAIWGRKANTAPTPATTPSASSDCSTPAGMTAETQPPTADTSRSNRFCSGAAQEKMA